MKPLFVLLGTFAVSLLVTRLGRSTFDVTLAGRIALAVMLVFTATGHFIFTRGMTAMLPAFVPFRAFMVYLTGVLEILAAVGLFVPGLWVLTGYLLVLFFILILPANIYAAANHLNYETGATNGKGLAYLWFRVPFQLLLMGWAWYFAIR
ncbi:hypothetical protein [Emticicia sp. TH156]|uniref:DoxX family protein n=1 Tax=Emticicia sp. TH156 TaxID=2067454 RepID=UPI000C759DE4|nr:hypothetical protein [Emticicia sp. TH156]PLK44445.1 hypothetical protein C0V77_11720 [Emticicia sp. TH156]